MEKIYKERKSEKIQELLKSDCFKDKDWRLKFQNLTYVTDLDNILYSLERYFELKNNIGSNPESSQNVDALLNRLEAQISRWFKIIEQLDKEATGETGSSRDKDIFRKSVESSSNFNRTLLLSFFSFLFYILITVAGTTDLMVLLNNPVELPIVKISIPIYGFFFITPILLIATHLNILFNLKIHTGLVRKFKQKFVVTKSKTLEKDFTKELWIKEEEQMPSFFLNSLFSESLTAMEKYFTLFITWLFLYLLPILILSLMQIKFSKFQNLGLTTLQFAFLVSDAIILFIYWPIIINQNLEEEPEKNWKYFPLYRIVQLWKEKATAGIFKKLLQSFLLVAQFVLVTSVFLFSAINLKYVYNINSMDGEIPAVNTYLFHDSIVFPKLVLIGEVVAKEKGLASLQKRNLIYSDFINCDLSNVDFQYANLSGASFFNIKLLNTQFYGSTMDGIYPSEMKILSKEKPKSEEK